MRRRLFSNLSAISLVLCAATLCMWLFAQHHPHCWATLRWQNSPERVKSSMQASGWNEKGFFSRSIDDEYFNGSHLRDPSNIDAETDRIIALSADQFESQLEQARRKLLAAGPPGIAMNYSAPLMPNMSYLGRTNYGSHGEINSYYPFGLLICWLGALPCIWVAVALVELVRKRMQLQPGCCSSCGYDLRASPERCPECGAVPVGGKA